MAAPVVSRPPVGTLANDDASGALLAAANVAQWAKWISLGLAVAGVVALIIVGVITYKEQSRVTAARTQWDLIFETMKDKTNTADRKAALEGLTEKLKGTKPHAYVLMELAGIYFDEAIDAIKTPEEKKKAIEKATQLYKLVATEELFAGDPMFGPFAVQGEAIALEQAQEYDAAISLLEEKLPKLEKHLLYNQLLAQMGRLYWLRSQQHNNDPKDCAAAREKLAEVLRTEDGILPGYGGRSMTAEWRKQAEYIKSLVDKRGKGLPDGTAIPPVKTAGGAGEAKTIPLTPAVPNVEKKEAAPKAEPKKEEAPKAEPKKDEAKK